MAHPFVIFFFLSKNYNNFNIFLSNLIFDNNILLLPFEVSFSLHGHVAALHSFPKAPMKVTSPRCKKLVQNMCKGIQKFLSHSTSCAYFQKSLYFMDRAHGSHLSYFTTLIFLRHYLFWRKMISIGKCF